MKYSDRVNWVAGEGAAAWDIHYQSLADSETDDEVIVLSVGDPDFATPSPIIDKAVEALRSGDTHYTPITGRLGLRTAIAESLQHQGVPNIDAGNVAVLAGAQNALFTASLCLFSAGDEVLTFDPMYLTYEAYIGVSGANLVRIACDADSGFRPNAEDMENAVTAQTRAIVFSNPNNPSGIVMTQAELEAIAEVAKRHDLWVISDEVYASLSFENSHISIASLPDMAERTITVSSLSKSHAMTGWRIGWMVGPHQLIDHAENMALCMLYGLPGFLQEASISALQEHVGESQKMRDIYQHRRDLVSNALSDETLLEVLSPQAGMFVLVDVRMTGLSARDFSAQLYAQEKVSVLDGSAFGNNVAGFIRLSFTNSDAILLEGCERIKRFVTSLAS